MIPHSTSARGQKALGAVGGAPPFRMWASFEYLIARPEFQTGRASEASDADPMSVASWSDAKLKLRGMLEKLLLLPKFKLVDFKLIFF